MRQLGQSRVVERGDDQQNAIGAEQARFVHLPGVDQEILAQHRQAAGRTRFLQIRVATLEKIHIGEHRQASGAAGLVTAGNLAGAKIRANHALARAGFLDFGDNGRSAAGDARAQGRSETARRRRLAATRLQLTQGQRRRALAQFFGLARENGLQNIAHAVRSPRGPE